MINRLMGFYLPFPSIEDQECSRDEYNKIDNEINIIEHNLKLLKDKRNNILINKYT